MKKSFVVIGLGRFGLGVVKTLSNTKCDILAIDVSEERVTKAAEYVNHCIICDSTKKSNLKDLGVGNMDHAIVAIGNNLQATILTTINLGELGVPNITVRVDEEDYIQVVERLGATDVIIPEEASAKGLANQIISDTFLDYYNLDSEHGVAQIMIPMKFKAQSLIDLDPRNHFDVNIVGITKKGKLLIPKGTDNISPGDVILVVGKNSKILKFDQYISGENKL